MIGAHKYVTSPCSNRVLQQFKQNSKGKKTQTQKAVVILAATFCDHAGSPPQTLIIKG